MERFVGPARDFQAATAHLSIDAAVHDVLEALDGSRTLWKAAQTARSPRALGALWVLDAVGALAYSDAPRAREAAGAENEGSHEAVHLSSMGGRGVGRPFSSYY